jgi:hypothetical protein
MTFPCYLSCYSERGHFPYFSLCLFSAPFLNLICQATHSEPRENRWFSYLCQWRTRKKWAKGSHSVQDGSTKGHCFDCTEITNIAVHEILAWNGFSVSWIHDISIFEKATFLSSKSYWIKQFRVWLKWMQKYKHRQNKCLWGARVFLELFLVLGIK